MNSCFYCKGNMVDDTCNYMVDMDGHFIIIKNVPCHKCTQCGEVSFSGVVIAKMEEMVETLKTEIQEVSIAEFAA